jgi:hypothetical protein
MHEMAARRRLARPQPRHPTGFAMLPPDFSVDMTVVVEWRDENVGDAVRALGMTLLAGKLEPDLAKG